MILQGIPISEEQCIGDSLQHINNAFVTLSTFVLLSGGGGSGDGGGEGAGSGGGTIIIRSNFDKRWSYVPGDPFSVSFTGVAPLNSNPNQNVWTVTRIVYRVSGDIAAVGVAKNCAWNNRLTLTYVSV
jgi:hypothetical protein